LQLLTACPTSGGFGVHNKPCDRLIVRFLCFDGTNWI
jgi:hypothetical protein